MSLPTVSIRDVLSMLPDGGKTIHLDDSEVGRYLNKHYNKDSDKKREKDHALRDDFYSDGGVDFLRSVIDDVFVDEQVRELRKKWAPYSNFNNPVKNITNAISTVYLEPAVRTVEGDSNNDGYQAALRAVRFNSVAQSVNRMFNLHRALIVGPRIRVNANGSRTPVIDIVTPAAFRFVTHPADSSAIIGHLVRLDFRLPRTAFTREPKWSLWTDHERVYLDENFMPVDGTWVEHGLGTSRWVSLVRQPIRPGVFPGNEGADLVAAHVSIGISNILLLKETKSATKQTILAGDASAMVRGQALDSEVPVEVPDGTAMQSMDMSMDTSLFTRTADHILEHVANNHGMSAALIKHQGVQSAEARELMRVPLRELRREQQPMFREFESSFAAVFARVLEVDAPDMKELHFSTDGWRIDFGEAQTPLSQSEELVLFEKKRAAGLDSTIAFLMRGNPDLTEEQAQATVALNLENETWRIEQMRTMQAMSGGPSQTVDDLKVQTVGKAADGPTANNRANGQARMGSPTLTV